MSQENIELLSKVSDAIDKLQESQEYATSKIEEVSTKIAKIDTVETLANSKWTAADATTTSKGYGRLATATEVENTATDSQVPGPAFITPENLANFSQDSSDSGGSRNVGEIVYSLIPLVDAGLHLLNGDEILGEGVYKAFVDYMAGLYEDGNHSNLFVTETEWQTSVATYGVCGHFVYNSETGNLRLPKVTGFVEGTIVESAIGDLVEAGLPNITGEFHAVNASDYTLISGAFEHSYPVTGSRGMSSSTGIQGAVTFDASRSSSIYGNSNTVQPQSVKGYVYIVLANSKANPVTVQIDNVVTDINSKVTASGAAHAAMPSGQYMDLTLPANGGTVTAPADGWIYFVGISTNSTQSPDNFIGLNIREGGVSTGDVICTSIGQGNNANSGISASLPVNAEQTVFVYYAGSFARTIFRFVYANGSAS